MSETLPLMPLPRASKVRRVARLCAVGCLCLVEPVFHSLGIPHPEGLAAQAANYLVTLEPEQT